MDASKFSNFTIDYILGERTGSQTHGAGFENTSSASQTFQQDTGNVNFPGPNGHQAQSTGAAVMGFQCPCPGISYNTLHCCGPVTYYQTNFNVSYCSGEPWFLPHPEGDREECHGHYSSQFRHRSRIRTVFTESQVQQLDQLFNITDYPSAEDRAQLARNTGLSEETVRVWFKNRRARRKRQKSTADSGEP